MPLVVAIKAPVPLKEASEPALLVVAVKAPALLEESATPLLLKEAVGATVEEVAVPAPLV